MRRRRDRSVTVNIELDRGEDSETTLVQVYLDSDRCLYVEPDVRLTREEERHAIRAIEEAEEDAYNEARAWFAD